MEIEGSTGKTNDLGSATQIRSRKIYSTRPEQEQRHPHRSITKSNIIPARTSPRAWSSPGQSAPKNMVIPDRSAPRVLSSRPERSGVEGSAVPEESAGSHRLPTLADYPALRYTEQVFAESMRLYPPAWAMGRLSTRPVTLGPYSIPPGAHFFMSQYIVGRSPEFYPDPLRFDPDRFTPEAKAARHRFAYFPFGAGSRQCIGESFAWMEGVLAIATIASRWKMTYLGAAAPVPQAKITLRPRDPLMMRLSRRSPG